MTLNLVQTDAGISPEIRQVKKYIADDSSFASVGLAVPFRGTQLCALPKREREGTGTFYYGLAKIV